MAKCKGEGRMVELKVGAGRAYTVCPLCGGRQYYTGYLYGKRPAKIKIKAHQERR